MNDEEQLVNLDNVDPVLLRPEFREGVDQLIDLIFSKAQAKRCGCVCVGGGWGAWVVPEAVTVMGGTGTGIKV